MRSFVPLLLALLLPAVSYGQGAEVLYARHCAGCHHEERIGRSAPPLLSLTLGHYSDEDIARVIREGIPATSMPPFKGLGDKEVDGLVAYLRGDARVEWGVEDVESSRTLNPSVAAPATGGMTEKVERGAEDAKSPVESTYAAFSSASVNMTAVVERGAKKVWIMDGTEVVDRLEAANVHGGLKFSSGGARLFVPSRDGWITSYDLGLRAVSGRVRACVYLRGMAVSRDDRLIVASCWLPSSLVVLDSATLGPARLIPVDGKVGAVYELSTSDTVVFTFRDRPLIGVLDTRTLDVSYIEVDNPIGDFFVDPFDRFIVGSTGRAGALVVYGLSGGDKVFEYPVEGMPHLASAAVYYQRGEFYFATPHINRDYVTIWRMYDWGFVDSVETGGDGIFARTHPRTPYLWTDDGGDNLVLIEKRGLGTRRLVPARGKRVIHTGFSGDGAIAYVSLYDPDGQVVLYDSRTLEEIRRFPADVPVGKYNYLTKTRAHAAYLLGSEVFMEKCWGCHHPTRRAFGPSLRWIADNRTDAQIRGHIADPEGSYRLLGYERNAMPRIELGEYEVESLVGFIRGSSGAAQRGVEPRP